MSVDFRVTDRCIKNDFGKLVPVFLGEGQTIRDCIIQDLAAWIEATVEQPVQRAQSSLPQVTTSVKNYDVDFCPDFAMITDVSSDNIPPTPVLSAENDIKL